MNLNSHTMCAWNAVTMTAKKSSKRLEDSGNDLGRHLNLLIFF